MAAESLRSIRLVIITLQIQNENDLILNDAIIAFALEFTTLWLIISAVVW